MAFRFRRSVRIMPGVRLNFSARSMGLSFGVPGARVSVNTRGQLTKTFGLPGSGMSWTERRSILAPSQTTQGTGRASRGANLAESGLGPTSSGPVAVSRAANQVSPGLFAPPWEKDRFTAVFSTPQQLDRLEAIAASDRAARHSCMLFDVLYASASGDPVRAHSILEALWAEGVDPGADPFLRRYVAAARVGVGIASGVMAELPYDRVALGLVLAEARQLVDDLAGAVGLVESLPSSPVTAASLADLYAAQERWEDVLRVTTGVLNSDDLSMFLLVRRAAALRRLGRLDESRENFVMALAARKRSPELRQVALIERAWLHLDRGDRALARSDLNKVVAQDGDVPGMNELLVRLGQPAG